MEVDPESYYLDGYCIDRLGRLHKWITLTTHHVIRVVDKLVRYEQDVDSAIFVNGKCIQMGLFSPDQITKLEQEMK